MGSTYSTNMYLGAGACGRHARQQRGTLGALLSPVLEAAHRSQREIPDAQLRQDAGEGRKTPAGTTHSSSWCSQRSPAKKKNCVGGRVKKTSSLTKKHTVESEELRQRVSQRSATHFLAEPIYKTPAAYSPH
jgi:SRSO17 transposase